MEIFNKLDIHFKNKKLYETALTHTSFSNEHKVSSYERLEYLGDAVLELLTSEYLYLNTNLKEGQMSKKRSGFVCESALCLYAKSIGLDKEIRVGNGLLNNINETIDYIKNDCSAEEFVYISELYDEIVDKTRSKEFIDCLYEVAKKYPKEVEQYNIMNFINWASNRLDV